MKITPGDLPEIRLVEGARHEDERGGFERLFDAEAFAGAGLVSAFAQVSLSTNQRRGTLRGLHWQAAPMAETKLVQVVAGAVLDVVVDIRPDSPDFGRHVAIELRADRPVGLYVPPGFAHGFQSLTEGAAILYHIDRPYRAELARGLRFDDPALGIDWPDPAGAIVSARDRALPLLAAIR